MACDGRIILAVASGQLLIEIYPLYHQWSPLTCERAHDCLCLAFSRNASGDKPAPPATNSSHTRSRTPTQAAPHFSLGFYALECGSKILSVSTPRNSSSPQRLDTQSHQDAGMPPLLRRPRRRSSPENILGRIAYNISEICACRATTPLLAKGTMGNNHHGTLTL